MTARPPQTAAHPRTTHDSNRRNRYPCATRRRWRVRHVGGWRRHSPAPSTLSKWAQAVPHKIPDFDLKRVRSGVETLLSSLGIVKDDRGELQSHGLSGVQRRHYDAHDYMPEKRRALEVLFAHLEPQSKGTVVSIKRRTA